MIHLGENCPHCPRRANIMIGLTYPRLACCNGGHKWREGQGRKRGEALTPAPSPFAGLPRP